MAFGESGQTDGRRAADRFTYDEMNNMRAPVPLQAVPGAAVQRPQGAPHAPPEEEGRMARPEGLPDRG